MEKSELSEEIHCTGCHKVIWSPDPNYADNHHESYVKKKLCSYCSMDKIDLDYDNKFKETQEMIIFLKALKTTFWFFFWSGSFLLGFIIGRSFK